MCIFHGKEESPVLICCIVGNNEDKRKERGEGGLIKRGILLCLMSLLFLGGCQKKENTPNLQEIPQQEENKKPEVSLSENLWDFEFSIGEDVWELPLELSKWEEKGWSFEGKQEETMLEGETYIEGETLKNQEQEIYVDFVNPEGEKKPLKECYIGGILLKHEEKDPYYQLPGGITLGESTIVEVTDKFGTPTDEYEEKEDIYIMYEYGKYKEAELVFHVDDEVLYQVRLKNYREPENEEEQISDEIPEVVKEYKTPEEYNGDFQEYIVKYDDFFYQIPAPVSEFVENGWTISEEGSDNYVKAGRHGYVTLEKNGQSLYAVVKNYGEETTNTQNTFVTNLSGDFDVTKVSIGVGDEIVLGMSAGEMRQRMEESLYEKEEDEKGENYYIYSDESKKNFIRIFVDRDLQLVREIEVSHSPETLYEGEENEDERINSSNTLLNEETITEE